MMIYFDFLTICLYILIMVGIISVSVLIITQFIHKLKTKTFKKGNKLIIQEKKEIILQTLFDGTIIFVNQACCNYFDKQSEELIGHNINEFILEEEYEKIKKTVYSLKKENPINIQEYSVKNSNEEDLWNKWITSVIFNQNGNSIGFQFIGENITKYKQTESELRKLCEELELWLEERTEELIINNQALLEQIDKCETKEKELKNTKKVLETIKQNKSQNLLRTNQEIRFSDQNTYNNIKILVVEDNSINLKLVSVLLQKKGYKVIGVGNGKEALKILEKQVIDLILMDIQMPEMDGFETTAEIRKRETKYNIPIVAMTAYVLKESKEKCIRAGMDDYISKPINANEFYAVIERLLDIKIKPENSVNNSYTKFFEIVKATGGDKDLAKELAKDFFDIYPSHLKLIEQSLKNKDAKKVIYMANKLKGAILNFGIRDAYDLANKLETMGIKDELKGALNILEDLKIKLEQFKSEFLIYEPNIIPNSSLLKWNM